MYLLRVWITPHIQLSVLDELVMGLEIAVVIVLVFAGFILWDNWGRK